MNYIKPNVPLIPNPVNLDAAIQKLQTLLGTVPWLEVVYGRATTGIRKTATGKEYKYPEVYAGKGDYLILEPNNYLSAHAFFKVDGSREAVDWTPFKKNSYRVKLSLIVWANLDRVKTRDTTLNYQHRFKEELMDAVNRKLEGQTAFRITKIYEEPGDVFAGYSLNHVDNQTFKHPEYGFRIEGLLTFDEFC